MILEQLTLLNYKNIEEAILSFSPNVNCLIGDNGMGKTNVLDAIYYLSFCKSASLLPDHQIIRHEADLMMLQGRYRNAVGEIDVISCGLKRGQRKHDNACLERRCLRQSIPLRRRLHFGIGRNPAPVGKFRQFCFGQGNLQHVRRKRQGTRGFDL